MFGIFKRIELEESWSNFDLKKIFQTSLISSKYPGVLAKILILRISEKISEHIKTVDGVRLAVKNNYLNK